MTDLQEAEQGAIRLLAPREHSRLELRRKLLKRDHAAEVVEEVLQRLEAHGLLSDERFVEQYIAMRKRKGYGPVRIRKELRERGINDTLIHEWIDERDDEWRANMKQVVEKKFSILVNAEYKEQARLARFLEYRGFPNHMIRDYLFHD
ncbi:MAG: regulatory protein RecX [Pseudomonadota bacterium]|nr:regulatory protein RecX [Pseudomonadota bacterium]